MKEITRRLYTKPVMLSIAFLIGMGLLVGMFVTGKSRAAVATTYIQAGNDEFETTANGESFHDFSSSKIPADFFGPGSNEFAQLVPVQGVALNPAVNQTDTIIQRTEDVYIPGHQTTPLQMTALSLRSIGSFNVTYTNGSSEAWTVAVGLSIYKASTGSMTINAGGTFDSSLKVWPRFTFRRVSDNKTLIYDTGSPTGPGLTASSEATAIGGNTEPAPAPTVAPCVSTTISDFDGHTTVNSGDMSSAATSSSCAPVTLTSTNSPWSTCNGRFCIPVPITEADRWAAHNASPPGTKKQIQVKAGTVAE